MTEKENAQETTLDDNLTGSNKEETGTAAEDAAETPESGAAADNGEADTPASDDAADVSELERQLEEQRQAANEHYQRYLRTQADFDNFRRRSRQEKEEFAKYASMKLLEQLLPVLDNFERAIASSKDNKDFDALAKGVDMIFRQFSQVLEQEGLTPMNAVGQPFNPEFHQAIMQVESEDHEEGIVVEEVQKGYMLKDRVLRPAMVKVSS